MIKHSLSERRDLFFLLLGIFVFASALLAFVLFYDGHNKFRISKHELESRVQDDWDFEQTAAQSIKLVDSVTNLINRYNPDIQAVFLENDIKKVLSEIQTEQLKKDYDVRFQVFTHASQFYDNYFMDKRELKGNLKDIERIQKMLDDCFINRQQIQQSLTFQKR